MAWFLPVGVAAFPAGNQGTIPVASPFEHPRNSRIQVHLHAGV